MAEWRTEEKANSGSQYYDEVMFYDADTATLGVNNDELDVYYDGVGGAITWTDQNES